MPLFENKHISGMIHLGSLDSKNLENTFQLALNDAQNLAAARVDSLLLENWNDNININDRHANMMEIGKRLKMVGLPLGVNVLPNEWRAAFQAAEAVSARFVELDVFVDEVYPPEKLEPEDIQAYRKRAECRDIEFYPMIHPKHRTMVDRTKTMLMSARQAKKYGADGVVVTGTLTGIGPDTQKLAKLRKNLGDYHIVIGSGLTAENAADLLKYADGAIVGTYLKKDGVTDNPVDYDRAVRLMKEVMKMR